MKLRSPNFFQKDIFRFFNYDGETDSAPLELSGAPHELHYDQFGLVPLPTKRLAIKCRLACREAEREARKCALAEVSLRRISRRMRDLLTRPMAKRNPIGTSLSDKLHIWFMTHARHQ